jgi:hypothetical protein
MLMQAFAPLAAANSTFANSIAVSAALANVATALPGVSQSANQIRVVNLSGGAIAINFGQTAAQAVAVFPTSGSPAAGYVMPVNSIEVFTVPPQVAYIGIIGLVASGTVYVTQGEGV